MCLVIWTVHQIFYNKFFFAAGNIFAINLRIYYFGRSFSIIVLPVFFFDCQNSFFVYTMCYGYYSLAFSMELVWIALMIHILYSPNHFHQQKFCIISTDFLNCLIFGASWNWVNHFNKIWHSHFIRIVIAYLLGNMHCLFQSYMFTIEKLLIWKWMSN